MNDKNGDNNLYHYQRYLNNIYKTMMHWFNICTFVFLAAFNILSQHSFHQVFPLWFDDASYHMRHHHFVSENYAASWTYRVESFCNCFRELLLTFLQYQNKDGNNINKKHKKSKICN